MTTTQENQGQDGAAGERNSRRSLQGIVTSTKMDKTITVRVERRHKHPKYLKYIRSHAKFLAHDEEGKALEGDFVEIDSTRPLSKRKRWRLTRVISTGGINEKVVPGSDVTALLEDSQ